MYETRRLRTRFYGTMAWRRKRKEILERAGFLCECGCGKVAEEIHHLSPLEKRPDLALADENLRALARGCHFRIDALPKIRKNPDPPGLSGWDALVKENGDR